MAMLSYLQGRQGNVVLAWEPCVFQTHCRGFWNLFMAVNLCTDLMVKQMLMNDRAFYILQDLVIDIQPRNSQTFVI